MQYDVKSLAERILLVSFTTGGRPRFQRKNRAESKKTAQAHGVDEDKVTTGVDQCKHPLLKETDKHQKACTEMNNYLTMPTVSEGMRQLRLEGQMAYLATMGTMEATNQDLLNQFYAVYPQLKADAPIANNGLYDPSPWKELSVLQAEHQWSLQVLPCPSDGAWGKWLDTSLQVACIEIEQRLCDALKRVAERCAADGPLYKTVFTDLKEVLDLVPSLNLADDPKIKAIARQAAILADQDKDNVVKRPQLRKNLAAEADRLLSMFGPPPSIEEAEKELVTA